MAIHLSLSSLQTLILESLASAFDGRWDAWFFLAGHTEFASFSNF